MNAEVVNNLLEDKHGHSGYPLHLNHLKEDPMKSSTIPRGGLPNLVSNMVLMEASMCVDGSLVSTLFERAL